MKLIIEPPTWLGDSVMASGAIKALIDNLNPSKAILFGSFVATEILKDYFDEIIVRSKSFKEVISFPKSDIFVSFKRSFYSKLLGVKAKKSYFFDSKFFSSHMVEKYSSYVNLILNKSGTYKPTLPFVPKKFSQKVVGINPGAAYGSAKRWYPKEFAKVANELDAKILIFGGEGEEELAKEIEKHLKTKNYENLCGKLTIKELCEYIGGLNLLITNDSGPMHIAAAYGVNIIAIFGPTNYKETFPYGTDYKIISKHLECSPCMKRVCPLKHHNCMKLIKAKDVLKVINESGFFR